MHHQDARLALFVIPLIFCLAHGFIQSDYMRLDLATQLERHRAFKNLGLLQASVPVQSSFTSTFYSDHTLMENSEMGAKRVVVWDEDSKSFKHTSRGKMNWGKVLARWFFPSGKMTADYYKYAYWRAASRLVSAISGVFGTQALLLALGFKKDKIGLAAATTWVLKDCLGKASRIYWASKNGRKFDGDAKKWRFRASLLFITGNTLEIFTYIVPSVFLITAALANALKQTAMLTSSATRNTIYKSFDLNSDNIGDITAKGEAQAAVIDLLGLALGIRISKAMNLSKIKIVLVFVLMSITDTFCVFNEIKSVVFRQLNFERCDYVLEGLFDLIDSQASSTTCASVDSAILDETVSPDIATVIGSSSGSATASELPTSSSVSNVSNDSKDYSISRSSLDSSASRSALVGSTTTAAAAAANPTEKGQVGTATMLIDKDSRNRTTSSIVDGNIASGGPGDSVTAEGPTTDSPGTMVKLQKFLQSIVQNKEEEALCSAASCSSTGKEEMGEGELTLRRVMSPECVARREQLLLPARHGEGMIKSWTTLASTSDPRLLHECMRLYTAASSANTAATAATAATAGVQERSPCFDKDVTENEETGAKKARDPTERDAKGETGEGEGENVIVVLHARLVRSWADAVRIRSGLDFGAEIRLVEGYPVVLCPEILVHKRATQLDIFRALIQVNRISYKFRQQSQSTTATTAAASLQRVAMLSAVDPQQQQRPLNNELSTTTSASRSAVKATKNTKNIIIEQSLLSQLGLGTDDLLSMVKDAYAFEKQHLPFIQQKLQSMGWVHDRFMFGNVKRRVQWQVVK